MLDPARHQGCIETDRVSAPDANSVGKEDISAPCHFQPGSECQAGNLLAQPFLNTAPTTFPERWSVYQGLGSVGR